MSRYAYSSTHYDFTPAPTGWSVHEAVRLDDGIHFHVLPLAGWVTLVETRYDARTCEDDDPRALHERPRSFVPAVWTHHDGLLTIDEFVGSNSVAHLVGPGEVEPDPATLAAELRSKVAER